MKEKEIIIKGKVEYIDKIVEELEEEGITLSSNYTSSSPEDHIVLYLGGLVSRYCHQIDDENADLIAHLPSHRKHFIKKCKEVLL